jgi:ribosomal protein S25
VGICCVKDGQKTVKNPYESKLKAICRDEKALEGAIETIVTLSNRKISDLTNSEWKKGVVTKEKVEDILKQLSRKDKFTTGITGNKRLKDCKRFPERADTPFRLYEAYNLELEEFVARVIVTEHVMTCEKARGNQKNAKKKEAKEAANVEKRKAETLEEETADWKMDLLKRARKLGRHRMRRSQVSVSFADELFK